MACGCCWPADAWPHIIRSRRSSTARSQVTLTGTVTKIEWTNPHVWVYLNVKDKDTGEVTNWGFEMGPPHVLQRRGWRRDTLKIGDEVSVDGSLAKNGTKRLNARTGHVDDRPAARPGETLDAGSSQGGVNPRRTRPQPRGDFGSGDFRCDTSLFVPHSS